MITLVSLLLLVGVLGFAVARPRGLPEAVAAVPAAVIVVVTGLVPGRDALHELADLGPTVGFLAAVLLLAFLADEAGVFRYAGSTAARWSRGSPQRLLGIVFAIAAVVTAALSLDATVVLLTPVVFATASTLGVRPKPHVYACNHLANSASLLLPVSNLTNLLAMSAAGLSFVSFAGLMAVPWLAVVAVEYVILRRFFADDLATPPHVEDIPRERAPRFALVVLGLTLAGFAVAGPLGVHPAWIALGGALFLAVRQKQPVTTLVRKANPEFCLFVLALGIVVLAVSESRFGTLVDTVAPRHADLLGLALMAGLAALLANVLNNLPATLMLLPLAAHSPGLVLAVLLGANIGPNLTYVGSLATLLWRRILHGRGQPPVTGEFLRLGALTVPACLIVGVASLWLSLRVSGL
ncbi:SLC13 family permease [Actinoplanes sp. N902-109]|uniref:SLC13 family permease n=1 Tax=Actinoplanes sp. (strain N902-109) TaxID=649831 RepID=UPI0003296012|nr:SLC13 family permease [Actinoplanes sp. N902-109]AGL21461.1 arsenical pump membrane protein [Actinoplanes sp. N902-109]